MIDGGGTSLLKKWGGVQEGEREEGELKLTLEQFIFSTPQYC